MQWFDLILSGSLIRSQRLSLISGERHPSMCSARIIIIRVMVVRMWLDSKCAFRERNLRLGTPRKRHHSVCSSQDYLTLYNYILCIYHGSMWKRIRIIVG